MAKRFYVYLITNRENQVLYTGVTSGLAKRSHQHREKSAPGFSARYNLCKLVHAEVYQDAYSAIAREKQIKSWKRSRKDALVEEHNPAWLDLADSF